jgi:hypothetical protein
MRVWEGGIGDDSVVQFISGEDEGDLICRLLVVGILGPKYQFF